VVISTAMKNPNDKVDRVIELLEQGESLRRAASDAGVAASTFLGWCEVDEQLAERYARARARGAEVEFERLREIVEEEPPVDDKGRVDSGWVQWKRMQVDTFKWQLAKKRPERYGDKVGIEHSGNVGLAINIDLGADK